MREMPGELSPEKRTIVCAVRNTQTTTVVHRLKDERHQNGGKAENDYAATKLLTCKDKTGKSGEYGLYAKRNNANKESSFLTLECCNGGTADSEDEAETQPCPAEYDTVPRMCQLHAGEYSRTLPVCPLRNDSLSARSLPDCLTEATPEAVRFNMDQGRMLEIENPHQIYVHSCGSRPHDCRFQPESSSVAPGELCLVGDKEYFYDPDHICYQCSGPSALGAASQMLYGPLPVPRAKDVGEIVSLEPNTGAKRQDSAPT